MIKILITGVGGGVGQSIVKSLQDMPYSLIGVDGEVLGTGLYAVQKAYQVPYACHPAYIEKLIEICKIENCSFIFPGLDAELPVLSRQVTRFKEIGVEPIVSSPEVIDICDDKLTTYQFLTSHHFNVPCTRPLSHDIARHISFPLVLKPMKGGARSRGVFIISNERELSFRLGTLDVGNYVAQEYIEGGEYTCGTVNFGGHCYGCIVMKRILRDGDTYKAFVVRDSNLDRYVRKLAEVLGPFGPCNFQLRIKDGKPYIFEINARCSGTTHSRALAGFNEPLMTVEYLTTGKMPFFQIREISVLRYWKELVIENSRIAMLKEQRWLNGDGSKL